MGLASTTSVSVVIVTRNERERVRGCIESVLTLCEGVDSEVILVDSNSSDGTVEVATEYPITVLQIPTDDLSTPGAGRQVGFRHASGDLVLFVDGDIHVSDGWLEGAIRTVEQSPDVAGVDGVLAESEADGDSSEEKESSTRETDRAEGDPERVDHLLGVALYDADALEAVGGFDPWLDAMEDIDLGYRLRRAGYRLLRLPAVVGSHPKSVGYGEIRRRWQSGYMYGIGQGLRKSSTDPGMAANWLSIYWLPVASGLWLSLGGLLAALRRGRVGLAWAAISSVVFAAAILSRGPAWTVHKTLSDLLTPPSIVLGLGRYDPDADEFPFDRVDVVTSPRSNRA